MSATSATVDAPTTDRSALDGRLGFAAAVALTVGLSLWIGWYQLFRYHYLHADLGYDDGVWFGTAVRIADGFLPYRSFVLDQPPGVPLLMVPFALLSHVIGTRNAFGLARLSVPVFEAVTVAAVGWLLRHRGTVAVLAGCGAAAVYPAAAVDERTVMLEPFCAMFCVLGVAVAFSGDRLTDRARRAAVAGAAFGLAGTCKAFAILPFVVVVAVFVLTERRRLLPFLGGAAAAFAVVCGPFVVLAPRQFLHQVVSVQLVRSQIVDPSRYERLFTIVSYLPSGTASPPLGQARHDTVAFVVVAVAVAVAAYALTRRYGPRGGITPLDVAAAGMVVVTAYGLMTPSAYYSHYAAFLVGFVGLLAGLVAGRIALVVGRAGVVGPAVVAAAAVVAIGVGSVHATTVTRQTGGGPGAAPFVDSVVPAGACVLTDDVPTLLLADRFVSSTPGCDEVVDAFGETISTDGGHGPGSVAAGHSGAVTAWRDAMRGAQYMVLTYQFESRRIPWQSALLRSYRERHFRILASSPGCVILIRRGLRPDLPTT